MEQIGIYKDGQIYDLQTVQELGIEGGEAIKSDGSAHSLEILRHSTAHMMAQAIKELYPEAKFFVGPVVKEGFYYDFKVDTPINDDDLKTIEKKMKDIASSKYPIEKYTATRDEIQSKFKDDELKQAVLSNITDDTLTIYKQGEFEDLCRGPHMPNTRMIRNFKLIRVAGAYLGGDEENEMITRIYGISFFERSELRDYITMHEEALKRDHRKLGTELKLFAFSDNIGAGLPLWLPAGARLRGKLEQLLYKAHRIRGYEPVRGPEILKADAWVKSGHYANYKENMYFTEVDGQEYGLKPMNCVGHIEVFREDQVSYRDLPMKFFEYGVVHRHELSGVMHGLFRVREFTQDDAHIFCTKEQTKDVIIEVLEFVESLMSHFNFTYEMEVSTKPKKAIGDDAFWETTTKGIMDALDENGYSYGIDEGGGAFYGPKIDIKILDAIGRKWQCGTIQVDMNLPERFDINYTTSEDTKEKPVMIHRAILGSFERFIGILTEHFAGEFPLSIAPTGVIIVPIADTHLDYAKQLQKELQEIEIDTEVSSKNESLNKRIRVAEKQKVPMILVVGDDEVANNMVALRDRRTREQSNITKDEFFTMIKQTQEKAKI
ncbi:MAG: threonine--tRNA ligase [Campylobacteraceae bacterium]|nr:threonine--tRNA ligase [Campylobacteraceae bacterium]MBT4708289.1 threonine--tRNA ligase [Campylobacteraceae bacterium]MBT5323954.1 threonine--tRNA ligase [Campylobacteraceae bacterium]MBT5982232.1 threonine--tRNA ligase [Campylobacteraceae bacterium]MBT6388337.1 threonine--tRNA ligase [Campylobacteraceae bacterium]